MKKIVVLSMMLFLTGFIFAQNEIDAFRFSEIYYSGTARANAMSNAFGALGGDLSTASTNPAGIGIFRHSEFSFTPSLMFSNVNSNFNGSEVPTFKLNGMLNNTGFVISIYNPDKDIRAFNFSAGYNRTRNFKRNYEISGVNNKGSMLDYFMLNANGYTPDQLDDRSYGAFDTWLLDTIAGYPTEYTNALWWTQSGNNTPQYGENQTWVKNVTGGAGEYFINGAVNYKDIFFFGATIGIQSFKYKSHLEYSENNFVDNSDLNSFTYSEDIRDEGTGINFKAGFIFKPVKFFRLGAAFHSPTYFTITDWYNMGIHSFWNSADPDGNSDYLYTTDVNKFSYNLLTPMRLMGDVGFVFGKVGLLDISYEHVDYSSMKMTSASYLFVDENKNISDTYQSVDNFRIGGEVRFGPMSLRGGYGLFGNPYQISGINFKKSMLSAGIGFRTKGFYVDFSYNKILTGYNQYMYNGYSDEPVPNMQVNDGIVSMTMGFVM